MEEKTINAQCIISTTQTSFQGSIQSREKLLTHGVRRKVIRGIPTCVTKEELKSKKSHIDTRGISKESVIEGDPKYANLIEASIYDNTPAQYISMVSE